MSKKHEFRKEIIVKKEDAGDGTLFDIVIGDPKHIDKIEDAVDGERVAIYRLVDVKHFHTNSRLK